MDNLIIAVGITLQYGMFVAVIAALPVIALAAWKWMRRHGKDEDKRG